MAQVLFYLLSNGDSLLASKSGTGFTREVEEIDFGTINDIPFQLEESFADSAIRYSKVKPWQGLVIVDGRVITGQSARNVGKAILNLLA